MLLTNCRFSGGDLSQIVIQKVVNLPFFLVLSFGIGIVDEVAKEKIDLKKL